MNNLIKVIFIFLLCSCEHKQSTTSNQHQIEYLNSKIKSSKNKLENKVLQTGYSPAGKRFIEISEQFTQKTNELINRIFNNEEITRSDIEELEHIVIYKYDTIPLDTAFIYRAFEQYDSKNGSDFITSLLMFNLSTINNTKDLFQSYFFDVEYFNPIVLSDNFTIKKGETFKGTAIAQAKMVAVKYRYQIENPQTDQGYMELPSWASSDYDGIINIKGTKIGTHKIKIKSIHTLNGEDKEFEGEFEITVTK